jgi:uncharacterized membrane protein YesL
MYCQNCDMELLPSIRMCPACGSKNFSSSKQSKKGTLSVPSNNITTTPKGLGGWLALLGFGLVFGLIRLTIEIISTYRPFIQNQELLTSLISPQSEKYITNFLPLFSLEIIYNIFILAFMMLIIYQYFTCSKNFPRNVIIITIVHLIFLPLNSIVTALIMPHTSMFDTDTIKAMFKSILAAAIWIPYLLKSKRVNNTFVK